MLRGYCKYLLQTGVPFSQAYVEGTFARYPLLARLLVELFEARFDPATGHESKDDIAAGQAQLKAHFDVLAAGDDATLKVLKSVVDARKGDRDAQMQAARDALLKLMDRVSSLDEDRILRSFMGVIDATLRTSYYQTDANGQHGRHQLQVRFGAGAGPAAEAVPRDLRVRPARGRYPPALRRGCAWRPALVGPSRRLPYRSAGPGQGTDGQEHRHRAGRREGWLLRQDRR